MDWRAIVGVTALIVAFAPTASALFRQPPADGPPELGPYPESSSHIPTDEDEFLTAGPEVWAELVPLPEDGPVVWEGCSKTTPSTASLSAPALQGSLDPGDGTHRRCLSTASDASPASRPATSSFGVAPGRATSDTDPDRTASTASVAGSSWIAIGPSASPDTGPVAAAAITGLAGLAAWILYRRLSRDELLDNELRRRIRDLLDEEPGATAATIADRLDVHYETVRHHLRMLDEFDEIDEREFGSTHRYFPNHGRYSARDRTLLAACRDDSRRRLLETLADGDGRSSGALAEAADLARSTTSHHLSRLRDDGLVKRRRDGRRVIYELADGVRGRLSRIV